MSYQGPNPNQPGEYPGTGEYGRGYVPPQQPTDPYSGQYSNPQGGYQQDSGSQYQAGGNQYQQPPSYGQPPYNQQWGAPQGSTLTTLGLDPRIEMVLCYALFWVSGLVIFFLEKQNRQVRFHAMQSIIVFGGLSILFIVAGWIPFLNILLVPLLSLVWFVAWIGLMVVAFSGTALNIPFVTEYANRYTDQFKF